MHSVERFKNKDVFDLNNSIFHRESWINLFSNSNVPFVSYELDSNLFPVRFLDANNAFCERVQYTKLELMDMRVEDILGGEVTSNNLPFINPIDKEKNLDKKNIILNRHYIISKLGKKIPFEFNGYHTNVGDKIIGLTIVYDLTAQINYEKKLVKSEAKYRKMVEMSPDAIFICCDKKIVYANKSAAKFLGFDSAKQVKNKMYYELFNEEQTRVFDVQLSHILSKNKAMHTFEFKINRTDGVNIDVHAAISLLDYLGKDSIQIVIRDFSEKKRNEELIKYLAYHDHLTGLPNRLMFNKRLLESIEIAKIKKQQLGVIFLDIDNFKTINDTLGHIIGDEMIIQASQRIAAVLCNNDMVSRIGGDEFNIFISCYDQQEIHDLMTKLKAEFIKPYYIKDRELYISFSAGISMVPRDGIDIDTLIKKADIALYYSKDIGRDVFSFYNNSMERHNIEVLNLATSIRKGLALNEFLLHYQPKLDIRTGKVIGSEALLRWNYKNKKILTPNQFIGIAEETKQILDIGQWVLHTACKQTRIWQTRGLVPIQMSVNISAIQLQQKNFYELVLNIIKDTGISPNLLDLEITESAIINNFQSINEMLNDFRKIGITISLDDFGTGYSSLSYLKRMSIDNLKIDRSFIVDVNECEKNKSIVQNIISMAHSLGLCVTAEGIEEEHQLEFLRNAHCDYYQGYLFSRPLPKKDFERVIGNLNNIETNLVKDYIS